jgi:hypothetical protein
MASERGRTARSTEQYACPECKHPVETVTKRRKTLGAWVPVWLPGPCHNPKCGARVPEESDEHDGTRPHR